MSPGCKENLLKMTEGLLAAWKFEGRSPGCTESLMMLTKGLLVARKADGS